MRWAMGDLFDRKPLSAICQTPERIISVYSLEQHVWADGHSPEARRERRANLTTIEEFQINPVRPFLNDIFKNMAAPWKREDKSRPVGQGYWVQAEFGSGKSHLVCFLSALALGDEKAWDIVKKKEAEAGRGKRDSLYRFWEEGLRAKSQGSKKGVLVVVKTLVGVGTSTAGRDDTGRDLTDYILDAVKEQLLAETGKNLSLYPAELLADRFLKEDQGKFRDQLAKFLHEPGVFEPDEQIDIETFLQTIRDNEDPDYKRSCGNTLWRFYDEYLKVRPQVEAEPEDVLKAMVETVLAEGYTGLLLVLDEVSLFINARPDTQRVTDEKTLAILSNRLGKVANLPLWTVCTAQQALQSRMSQMNIIADDRLKMVKLLERDDDYYDIVLSRVRAIKDETAIGAYYNFYKKGFSWPACLGEKEFTRFFPFHKPALEVVRAISYGLTTARTALQFLHQSLRHNIKNGGDELIRLWELFDEAVKYEEDPSGVFAGIMSIKARCEADYLAYESCRRQVEDITKGTLKAYRAEALRTVQTLFLYHVAKERQNGLTVEEIANSVLLERKEGTPEENLELYCNLADDLKKELRQIVETESDDGQPRYRFEPVVTGIDPRQEFDKARAEAERNQAMREEAWEALLALGEWKVRTRQITLDLSGGIQSIFRDIAAGDAKLDIKWQGRQISGLAGLRDFLRMDAQGQAFPPLDSSETDLDFALYASTRMADKGMVERLLRKANDPRLLLWSPDARTAGEENSLLNFAAYRKMVADWGGKETEDATTVINWVAENVKTEMGRIYKAVTQSYGRGFVSSLGNMSRSIKVIGDLASMAEPVVGLVLAAAYDSADLRFEAPSPFSGESAVKVINGLVRKGAIPKGARQDKDTSAAENYGYALGIMKRGQEKTLDVSGSRYAQAIWAFIEQKQAAGAPNIKMETLYKNFMGLGGEKRYGLSRRLVQLFTLCLAREGKIKVWVGDKAGLGCEAIDYANIGDIIFSAKILENLTAAQKMERPAKWDALRPYAEKLLGRAIAATADDAEINKCRQDLQGLFQKEREAAPRLEARAKALFGEIGRPFPYEGELHSLAELFTADLGARDDIGHILKAMERALDYQAFQKEEASPQEVDDLASRLGNYRDAETFLGYQDEIRAAAKYAALEPVAYAGHSRLGQAVNDVRAKLDDIKAYIDSEARLKNELVGNMGAGEAETGTIAAMIWAYSREYIPMHEETARRLAQAQQRLEAVREGDVVASLRALDEVTALGAAEVPALLAELKRLGEGLPSCPGTSLAALREALKAGPLHSCGWRLDTGETWAKKAEEAAAIAEEKARQAFRRKAGLFLNKGVRALLGQGAGEKAIKGLLACETSEDVQAYWLGAWRENPGLPALISQYMRRLSVKAVALADFKTRHATIQKEQLDEVVAEFREFLEGKFAAGAARDTVAVLRLE